MKTVDLDPAGALPSGLPKPLKAFLLQGVGAAPVEPRLVLAFNLLTAAGMAASTYFAILYFVLDFRTLWLPGAVALLLAAIEGFGPAIYRRSPAAGYLWLGGCNVVALTFIAWLTGADAGVQLFLPCIPALMLLVGELRYRAVAAVMTAAALAGMLGIEILTDAPAPFLAMSAAQQDIVNVSSILGLFGLLMAFIAYAVARMLAAEAAVRVEYGRSERLLENLLPAKIASRLKDTPDQVIADSIGQVSIIFADIVDFTPRASSLQPEEIVRFLNRVFTAFDAETQERGLEKIKTIGDAYMVAAGMPEPRDDHAAAAADMALAMVAATERLSAESGEQISIRVGMHTGPAVAGVIGVRKFFYDVWGDTVNMAARMESHGEPGRIQITAAAREALGDAYRYERRGEIEIKGKGRVETWWLLGRA